MRHQRKLKSPSQQRGVVLFVALILLLILSLLGVTAARMQTTEERMARNEDNRQIGAQAAEAALRAAETGLTTGVYARLAVLRQYEWACTSSTQRWAACSGVRPLWFGPPREPQSLIRRPIP